MAYQHFPDGLVIKNLPASEVIFWSPVQEDGVLLSRWAMATRPTLSRAHAPQGEKPAHAPATGSTQEEQLQDDLPKQKPCSYKRGTPTTFQWKHASKPRNLSAITTHILPDSHDLILKQDINTV